MKQRFNYRADAEAALASFHETYQDALHTHKGQVLAYTAFPRPRGRPHKDVEPKKTHYQVELRRGGLGHHHACGRCAPSC